MRPACVIVLAAGEGTRMRSRTPKVLHEALGRSLIQHVLDAVQPLQAQHTVVLVGHGGELVREHLAGHESLIVLTQHERRGTGHAVQVVVEQLAASGIDVGALDGPVMVVAGDTPLLRAETLEALLTEHVGSASAASVLTTVLNDPTGYGRVVRDASTGMVVGIVEHRDASPEHLRIAEINSGVYAFHPEALVRNLARLDASNAQGELYLTDVIGFLVSDGTPVGAVVADDSDEIHGINDRAQLAHAIDVMRARINNKHMRAGVTIIDPASTWIDVSVVLEPDVVIEPNCHLRGRTHVASGAIIGPDTTLVDVQVGTGARVRRSEATGASIGAGCDVGPFSYLRPGTTLADAAKVGAYVETKNASIGAGSKVPHLSYVGDATIGEGTNIGAATVFVNYDGQAKHHTTVGDHVRIGSDTMLVAPVTIGDGAYTAAGSVITEDVEPGAMAVARARQRNILGWVLRRRAGSTSAAAAARHSDDTSGASS